MREYRKTGFTKITLGDGDKRRMGESREGWAQTVLKEKAGKKGWGERGEREVFKCITDRVRENVCT